MLNSIRMTPISGGLVRPSLFGGTVQQTRTFHPTLAQGFIGQASGTSPADWYRRAKDSIAAFDGLLGRVARIANLTERNRILQWIGVAGTDGSPANRYSAVLSDLQQDVEAFTPPAINAYQVSRRTRRITELEAYNSELTSMVSNAETYYGKLQDPIIIDRERIVNPAASGTNWTLPIVVGAGAVGVALLVSALSGGK